VNTDGGEVLVASKLHGRQCYHSRNT
jgi:hypothetical protein